LACAIEAAAFRNTRSANRRASIVMTWPKSVSNSEVLSLIQRLPRSASPKVVDGFVDRIQPSSHIPSDVVEPSVLGIHDVQVGCGGVI
jgi:hypothetical protein